MKNRRCHHILLFFLLGGILLFSGISVDAAESGDGTGKDIVSRVNPNADGSYVQGTDVSDDTFNQSDNSPAEIPLRAGLKAYFSFKGPSLKDYIEKVEVYNERLDYFRALFGLNISF